MAADLQQSEILKKHIEESVTEGQLPENGSEETESVPENNLVNNDVPYENENEAVNSNKTAADEGSEIGIDFQDHVRNIEEDKDKIGNEGENGLNGIDESISADAAEEISEDLEEKAEDVTETIDNQANLSEEISETVNDEDSELNRLCAMEDGDVPEETANHMDADKELSELKDESMVEEENSSDGKLNEVVPIEDSQNDSSSALVDKQSIDLSPVGAEDEKPSSAVLEEEEAQVIENEETELGLENEGSEMISEELTEIQNLDEEAKLVEKVDDMISLDADAVQDSSSKCEKLSEVTSEVPQDDSGNSKDAKAGSDDTGNSILEESAIENVLDSNAEDLANALDLEQAEINSRSNIEEDKGEDVENAKKEFNIAQVNLVEDENKDSTYHGEDESFTDTKNAEIEPHRDIEENELIEGDGVHDDSESQPEMIQDFQENEVVDNNEENKKLDNANREATTDTIEGDTVVNDEVDSEDRRIDENEGEEKTSDILYDKTDIDHEMDTDQAENNIPQVIAEEKSSDIFLDQMDTEQKMDTEQLGDNITEVITEADKDSNEVDMFSEGITRNISEGLHVSDDMTIDNEDGSCELEPQHQSVDTLLFKENTENQDLTDVSVTNQESETSGEEQAMPDTCTNQDTNQDTGNNYEEKPEPGPDQEMGTSKTEQTGINQERGTNVEEQAILSDQKTGTTDEEQHTLSTDEKTGATDKEQPIPGNDQEMVTNDTEQSLPDTHQEIETSQEKQPVDDTSTTESELEPVESDKSSFKANNESESPMEVDEYEGERKSLPAADGKGNQDNEAMEVVEDSSSKEPAVDVDTEKPTESGSTVDKQGTTVPSMSEEPTTTAQGSQIKEETEDDVLELKIVGVTSAVGKEEETKVRPEEVELKIDSVEGADQTQQKTEEVIPKDSNKENSKPVTIKTEKKEEITKPEKEVQHENVTKKDTDDDVIAVKEEKKPVPPPPSKPKASKIQKCIVCSKVGKCKYNIVRNGDVKHLCDDTCFKEFRSNPTAFLKQAENDKNKAESTPKNGTQPTSGAVASNMDTQQAAASKVKTKNMSEMHQAAPYKTCSVCQLMNVKSSKPFLSWQGLDYCGEECLGKFQGSLSLTCNFCSLQIHPSAKARHCWRVGEEVKHFCSRVCSAEFVKRIKACAFCNKDLAKSNDSFMAPVGNQGMFKDFCSQDCLIKYEDLNEKETQVDFGKGSKVATVSKGNFACSVCSKVGPVKHEVRLESKVHKLCSDPCLSAFQYANKLTMNTCDNCGTTCFNDSQAPHYIQFEGKQKRFCSFMCVNSFRNQMKKLTPCAWCGTKKSNFDMIERVDSNNKFQLFCSLNCLSLYRVNLQATSNQAIVCDQCSKFVPAQYHLTMSDASVRNFCSYGCVMQFQAQFQTPANQKSNVPQKQPQGTNQQQVTTTRSGRVVTRGTKQQQYVDQQQQQQQRKEQARTNKANQDSVPIISNVVSLAPKGNQQQINIRSPAGVTVTDQQSVKSITTTSTGNQTVQQQIIIQPPPPKSVKNKSMWCKPLVQTKATACRPHTQTKEIQTEGKAEPDKVFVPVPVPIYCPTPLSMYTVPTPVLVPVPVPVPVPVFIPTTKKSSASILKQIKEIQEKIPADPLEAELLMMAEAVAGKGEDSSSDSDEGDTEAPATKEVPPASTGGELGEDMLQMALRMASEMSDEPVMDLETSLEPVAVNTAPPPPPPPVEKEVEPEDDEEYVPSTRSKRGRGSGKRSSKSAPRRNPKRQKTETPPRPQYHDPTPSPPPVQAPPPDVNFHLKYTYGVNAFKHWVTQKNAQLEQAMKPGNTRQLKTFKTDILQCTADELNYALCLFVKEVRKPNGEEYAVDSIYYLCLGIQQYLFESGRIDNVFTDMYYERFTECLNELLCRYEPKLNQAGQLVCRIEEEHLWESKQLGAHSPHVLLNTLVYFNTKYFMLKTSEDHLKLSFTHIMKHWKKTASGRGSGVGVNQGRSVYLRYYCPTPQTKENSQKKKKEEMPVYEQTENLDNPLRCPVKLYEFYLSKCPESIKNRNDTFYLIPERSCVPDSPVWYSTTMLGIDAMAKMLNRIRLVREIQEAHLHTQPIYI